METEKGEKREKTGYIKLAPLLKPGQVPIYVCQYIHDSSVGAHDHDFFELVFMVSGYSMHSLDSHHAILTAGDIMGVSPGQTHAYKNPFHAVLYNCLFTEEAISGDLRLFEGLPSIPLLFYGPAAQRRMRLPPALQMETAATLAKMAGECAAQHPGWQAKLKGYLLLLLVSLGRQKQKNNNMVLDNPITPRLVYRALHYIDENYYRLITLPELADLFHLSPDYFTRLFKKMVGLPPVEYIKVKRMEKACSLLETTEFPITEIARNVGYEDNNYFARVFKQVVGNTPLEYKNKIKSGNVLL